MVKCYWIFPLGKIFASAPSTEVRDPATLEGSVKRVDPMRVCV